MDNLCNQPFLLSLRQAVEQTGDLQGYEALLQEQQSAFKEYLQTSCDTEMPAPKRYQFLKTADYQLSRLRLLCGDKIKEKDVDFFRVWSMLIMDTRWFINVGVETLKFQAECPAHLLTEPSQTFPEFKWMGSRNDLTEAFTGLYLVDVIRLKDGSRPSYVLFAKFFGSFFGIPYSNPHDEMRRILNRKKNPTPFMLRIIDAIRDKSAKMDDLNK
jgi:hypothetical protein